MQILKLGRKAPRHVRLEGIQYSDFACTSFYSSYFTQVIYFLPIICVPLIILYWSLTLLLCCVISREAQSLV